MLDFQQCAGQPPTLDFSASVANVGLPWWLSGQRNQPALLESQVQSLGPEDPLEGGRMLAWSIPWAEEHGGLQSVSSQENRTRLSSD